MRSKPNRSVAAQRPQLPPQQNEPFQLGDLVLCRYSTYPYWPATIDQTHQPQRKGQHVCMHETAGGGSALSFWCTFSNEDTGGWVRADRIVLFHPDLLKYVRVHRNHRWSDAQIEAISVALRAFKSMHAGSTVPPPPVPPTDLVKKLRHKSQDDLLSEDEDDDEEGDSKRRDRHPPDQSRRRTAPTSKLDTTHDDEDPMDIGSDSSEEHHTRQGHRRTSTSSAGTPRAGAKSARKKRKSTGSAKTPGRPPKRSKSAEHHLEHQLLNPRTTRPQSTSSAQRHSRHAPPSSTPSQPESRRKVTPSKSDSAQVAALKLQLADMQRNLDKLTASLQRKEAALNQLREKGHTVSFAPVKTDTISLEQLPPSPDRDAPLFDSTEFEARVKAIRELFDKLDAAAKRAHDKRRILTEEQNKIRDEYAGLLNEVSDAQAHVVRYQSELSDLLRGVYQSRVAVHDLRKHQAGNLVRTMSKMCKDMPNVSAYCAALYRSWKKQVVEYVHNAPSSSKPSPADPADADAEGATPASGAADTPPAPDKHEGKENGDVPDDAGLGEKAHQKSGSDAAKQQTQAENAAPTSEAAAASAPVADKAPKSEGHKGESQSDPRDAMQVDTTAASETKTEPAKKEDAPQKTERMEVDDAKEQKAPIGGEPSEAVSCTAGDVKPREDGSAASVKGSDEAEKAKGATAAPEGSEATDGAKDGNKTQDEGKTEPSPTLDPAAPPEKHTETGGKTVIQPAPKPITISEDDRKGGRAAGEGLTAGTDAAGAEAGVDRAKAKQKAEVGGRKGGEEKEQNGVEEGPGGGDEAMKEATKSVRVDTKP